MFCLRRGMLAFLFCPYRHFFLYEWSFEVLTVNSYTHVWVLCLLTRSIQYQVPIKVTGIIAKDINILLHRQTAICYGGGQFLLVPSSLRKQISTLIKARCLFCNMKHLITNSNIRSLLLFDQFFKDILNK